MAGAAYIILEDCKKGDVVFIDAGEINGVGLTGLKKINADQKKDLIKSLDDQIVHNQAFIKIVEAGAIKEKGSIIKVFK